MWKYLNGLLRLQFKHCKWVLDYGVIEWYSVWNSGSSSIMFLDYRHITTHFTMSAGVSFCFIWILLWVQMKILVRVPCNEAHELKDPFSATSSDGLFGLFPTDSFTTFRLMRVLALSFLPDLSVSGFLLSLFTDHVARNLCVH